MGTGSYLPISSTIDNSGATGAQVTYDWTLPTDVASTSVTLQVTASTPNQPATATESGAFVLVGSLYVDTPAGTTKGSTQNMLMFNIGLSLFIPFKSTFREAE